MWFERSLVMKRMSGGLLAGLLLPLLCGSCSSGNGTDGHQRIVLTGSSTIAPLAAEIGKRFEKLHPGVRIDVQAGGSSRGIADVRQGLSDIGMASRDLKPSEAGELHAFPVARDGICMIVHRNNPLTSLRDEQVVAIYTGKVRNWKEVGGVDAPLTVVNKAEGRGTLDLFLHYFKLTSRQVRADVIIGDNEQGIKTVAGNPNAIGYVSIGTAEYDAAHGTSIKLLAAGDVVANIENVRNGTFPLVRTLNLLTREKPGGLVKTFIEFAGSARVDDLVKAQYFVPLAK